MTFGTADRRKADVAEGVALAVGHVATRRGNRLGVRRVRRRRAARCCARARAASGCSGCWPSCAREPEADGAGATSLGAALRGDRGAGRASAGSIVVVSDFRGEQRLGGPAAHAARPPRRARGRDPRPARAWSSPPVGDLWLDRSGDRAASCTSTRAARSVRKRFAEGGRGGARGGRRGAAARRRRPPRALDRGRLAADARRAPAPRRGRSCAPARRERAPRRR